MNAVAVQICGVCRAAKPMHFLVCDVCWAETPFKLKADYWTAKGNHHHRPKEWESRFLAAMSNIITHLKLHGSALS